MRTTGVRTVPSPSPRIHPPSHDAPKPLPRTKFLLKSTSVENPAPATFRSAPAPPIRSQSEPSSAVPPPKPPRTPSIREEQSTRPRQRTTAKTPARPIRPPPPQCHVPATSATSPSIRPSSSASTRPPPPQCHGPATSATSPSRRPSPSSGLWMSPSSKATHTSSSSVCSVDDFEDACKEVFRNTRKAKELSSSGKYVQAVKHYQLALTAVDQVLHAQVLSLSQHEPTRQRLFLHQQEVFTLRKEALNGFTDAQTAIRTPRVLSPTTNPPTPGAPPSYDDVLQEDNNNNNSNSHRHHHHHRHLRDNSRQPSTPRSTNPFTHTHQEQPTIYTRPPRTNPHHRPSPQTQTQGLSSTRSTRFRSNSSTEVMDARSGTAGLDMMAHSNDTVRPRHHTPAGTRPKSYHPTTKPPPPPPSFPPPLVPTHSTTTTTTLKPVLDEGVLNRMRDLHVHNNSGGGGGGGGGRYHSLTHSQMENIHSSPDRDNNTQPGKESGKSAKSVLENGNGASEMIGRKAGMKESNPFSGPSQVEDPFLSIDPFPLTNQQSRCSDGMLPDDDDDDDLEPTSHNISHDISQAFTDDFNPDTSVLKDSSLSPNQTCDYQSPDALGDSILEALDFATTLGHTRRVSAAQNSRQRGTTRYYSEENLLDVSRNTLEAILHSTGDRHGGGQQASIIEEFDPLMRSHTQEEGRQEETQPEPTVTKHISNSLHNNNTPPQQQQQQRGTANTPPPSYQSEGAVALAAEYGDEVVMNTVVSQHSSLTDGVKGRGRGGALGEYEDEGLLALGYQYYTTHTDEEKGETSLDSSQQDYTPMYSLPPPHYTTTSITSYSDPDDSPLYPCSLQEEEEDEDEEEREPSVDVGRSAFYLPTLPQSEVKRKTLLNIREGVKIYFIYKDNVVTSAWNKPVLTVYRDPSKDQLFSSGLVLCVGNSVWECELHKKATMVLRTHTGTGYVFNDVAGKQNCKAVAIRVPSGVRRAQQELLSGILQQHTMMEEERPKGITKAISKGASSAASRVNKLVEDESVTSEQTFVRRNSIRALKGVRKRLTSIAERTGATLKDLPEEYQGLQEAADSLVFALNAKMVQYI